MKKIYKKALVAGLSMFSLLASKAQVATLYSFTQLSGTYSSITGGTVYGNSFSDDDSFTDPSQPLGSGTQGPGIPIGFSFMFNNLVFDRIGINNNGWISFGMSSVIPSVDMLWGGFQGISHSNTGNLANGVSAFSRDIQAQSGSSLRVETIGTAPTRTCVIQWADYRKYNNTGDLFNFQIRLCETTNIVEVVYGNYVNNSNSGSVEVGLRGSSQSDYNNRIVNSTNIWNASIPGTNVFSTANFNNTLLPTSGQIYRWSPAQCSGVLQSLTATGNYTMICPNGNVNISLINSYTVSGIVYDWYDATLSQFGPFNPIVGSGGAAYTAAGLTVPTWFRVVATCLNGASSATSTVFGVAIAPTTTNTVPYYESFEGVVTNNDMPNCSWIGSNTPYVTQTYTSATNLNRSARTGTRFAAFYSYYTLGDNYFYSNGIEMHPGITYSASVWYKTEFYGYPNVTDLSIMIGTSQNPTGLNTIASTNGPASSGTYKSLSGLFTVPNSGLYYIAIKATGNGNYGTDYLVWDDLEVIIPCEGTVNSPTVSVTAATQTFCTGEIINLTANGADSYVWNNGTNGAVLSEVASNAGFLTYEVYGTNALTGCTSTVQTPVIINLSPVVFGYATDPVICAGQSANLMAGGNAQSYTWTPSTSPNSNVITVSPAVTTVYSLSGMSSSNGCISSSVIQVSVNATPSVTATSDAPHNPICRGESVNLIGSGASSYQWTSNSVVVFYGTANVQPQTSTVYTLTGIDVNGCAGKATYTLNVDNCTGIEKTSTTLSGIRVYPNPTSGVFTVELNSNASKMIELTDLTGRVILSTISNEAKTDINIGMLANGIYYAKILSDGTVDVIRIVKH